MVGSAEPMTAMIRITTKTFLVPLFGVVRSVIAGKDLLVTIMWGIAGS